MCLDHAERRIELTADDLIAGINAVFQEAIDSSTTEAPPPDESLDSVFPIVSAGVSEPERPFLFYAASDGVIKVRILVEDETVWASQRGMSEIFDVDVRTVSEHLQNVFKTEELIEESVIRKFRITAFDGKLYDTNFYNLDAIISVGYRVNSYQATQFRKWATTVLRGYLIKGFALDDDRLKQGKHLFGLLRRTARKDSRNPRFGATVLPEDHRHLQPMQHRLRQELTDLAAVLRACPRQDALRGAWAHVRRTHRTTSGCLAATHGFAVVAKRR